MGADRRGDFPRTLHEFMLRFHDDDSCLMYLVETRWPDGFRCPRCGHDEAWFVSTKRVFTCHRCRRQISVTAGTTLHRSKQPLTMWFTAAWLVSSLTPGISALQLQRQLGLKRYETAWTMLHKLRRAMVDPDRSHLRGRVEVDETWVGGPQQGLKGGRQKAGRKSLMVAVALERDEGSVGRLRMAVIPDSSSSTLHAFIRRNIAHGSIVVTDAWKGYRNLEGYEHIALNQAEMSREGLPPNAVPGVHRIISNLKAWIIGTHHGVGADNLEFYLDEFIFRFNRRRNPQAAFARLLGLGIALGPTTVEEIKSPLAPGMTRRRRGRSTGLTSTRYPARNAPAPDATDDVTSV